MPCLFNCPSNLVPKAITNFAYVTPGNCDTIMQKAKKSLDLSSKAFLADLHLPGPYGQMENPIQNAECNSVTHTNLSRIYIDIDELKKLGLINHTKGQEGREPFPANKSGCKYWGERDNSAKQRLAEDQALSKSSW